MAPSRLGRLLYSAVFLGSAVEHFQDMEGTIEYAEANDAPMAEKLVPFSVGMALSGAAGVVFWRFPKLALGAIASFLAGVTPVMHDFWNLEGQNREIQQINFMKNLSLLGAAIAMFSLSEGSTDGNRDDSQ
ncbi:quinol oxidase [Halobacteriales archaeon QS_8_65_32]|jgi:uncharacterized membrane protein YphA (DoxX/SURF4 family)|nr:MAG: quinol oxidase [Halobacteriales archaeon QS_8_65_32]